MTTRIRYLTRLAMIGILALAPSVIVARASSKQAWTRFRRNVAEACRAEAAPLIDNIRLEVDPFGSAHYGLALVTGTEQHTDARRRLICVYDKHTQDAEIGKPLDLEKPTQMPKPGASAPRETPAS